MERQILINIDVPECWDDEDFDYVTERLSYELNRNLDKRDYTIQEFEK